MNAVSPALASVLVVLIADFARRPVAEQARLKARVEDLVAQALQPLPPARRIMLDARQGVAVAVLDAPRLALELAERLHAGAGDLPLCIAINHGPVTMLDEATGGRGLVGDGIATAVILAEVAAPGRMIASRAFHDALLAEAPGRAARLSSAGKHTDAQVRTHDLYRFNRWAAWLRRLRLAAVGVVAFAGIVGLGFAARTMLQEKPLAPAVIEFQVAPRGDVYVDGVLKGQSPPLTRLEIAPGPHTIEVWNEPHPPLTVNINPGPAEVTTIAHVFPVIKKETKPKQQAAKEAAPKSWDEKLQDDVRKGVRDGWRSLRREIGF